MPQGNINKRLGLNNDKFRMVRGFAVEYDGQTTITYEWPCGHRKKINYGKGPVHKRVGVAGTRFFMSWHSKDKGGVNLPPCSKGCEPPSRKDNPR